MQKLLARGRPLLPESLGQTERWSEIADFQSTCIFALLALQL